MIFLCDGTMRDGLAFAAGHDDALTIGTPIALYHAEEVLRVQGQDAEHFARALAEWEPLFGAVTAFGVVSGPGSVGGVRSMVSMACACALARGVPVYPVAREQEVWHTTDEARAWITPLYAHSPRITPSTRDALGRKPAIV